MSKQLAVTSPYPNLRGSYFEREAHEGRPAFVRDPTGGDAAATWIFYSAKFGQTPCWYFGRCLPKGGSLSSFCRSVDGAASPEVAQWPPADITEVREGSLPPEPAGYSAVIGPSPTSGPPPVQAPSCKDCCDLKSLSEGLLCSLCSGSADSPALTALGLLKDYTSVSVRRKLASSFVSGDVVVTQRLENIVAAYHSQEARPLILVEPAGSAEIGPGTIALVCEAFSFQSVKLRYQWSKDGVKVARAERPRFVLSGAGPQDEGCYVCRVFIESDSDAVSTRPCDVRLSGVAREARAEEAAKRSRFEEPLHQASEAEKGGRWGIAVDLLRDTIRAADDNEGVRLNALSRRAELLLRLSRWQEAFQDATEAVNISPALARAHVSRATAAEKLEFLAEAVSSWETADFLGGFPEAAARAEECRQRLQNLFEERRGKWDPSAHSYASGDPEADWQRGGWGGRYTGGFFGSGNSGSSSSAGPGGSRASTSSALQKQLHLLGLAVDASGNLPSQDVVRSSYRKLALQAHPDKPGGSKTAFQELQNAYEAVLSAASA